MAEGKVLRTVPEGLEYAAGRSGAGFTFVGEDGGERTVTFEQLAERARAIAHALQQRGMRKGDRVAIVLPQPADFVPTFLGIVVGGGIAVPMYPPMALGQLGGYLDHARHIAAAAGISLLVTTPQIRAVLGTLHAAVPELRAILVVGDLEDGDPSALRAPAIRLDDPCFLQFTSGSTSRPKGVVVTHDNLAHNCHAIMREGLRTDASDRGLSWLPLFHDMGLIGFVLAPLHHRVPVTFLMPTAFLRRPSLWLQKLSEHRGTITYAPNFAYGLATRRVRDEEIEGLDLSALRVAGCGAEPIHAETLRAFARRFAPVGFRLEAFVPSYGMAESTLAIAFARGVPTDRVLAEPLWAEGRAEPAQPSATEEQTVEIVGCGGPFEDHGLRIVDVESRQVLGERRVGEIEVRGPSVMKGYWRDVERTAEVLGADGWMRTGDLGYLAGGQLFICGRAKDLIIVHGRNHHPQDIEWVAGSVEGVRTGNVVAFAASRPGLDREAVVVVAETREPPERHRELESRIRQEVQRVLGLALDEVVLAPPGTVPKTSSGKLQRSRARQAFEAGTLAPRASESGLRVAGRIVQGELVRRFAELRLAIFGSRRDGGA
ncbi:MAG: fatty acyl-AMP ligase [Myxococcota bacterium]|nr:fatty acyl-AMP ligase [Myxococcota bacterium]